MKTFRINSVFAVLIFVMFAFVEVSMAIPTADVSYLETQLDESSWSYEYTIVNSSDPGVYAGVSIYDFELWFNPSILSEVIGVPDGWFSVDEMFSAISDPGSEIAPGYSLSGFVFLFDQQVGNLEFMVLFVNPSDEDPFFYGGTTAPFVAPVPEPATLLLLAAGMGGLGLVRRRRVTARPAKGCA